MAKQIQTPSRRELQCQRSEGAPYEPRRCQRPRRERLRRQPMGAGKHTYTEHRQAPGTADNYPYSHRHQGQAERNNTTIDIGSVFLSIDSRAKRKNNETLNKTSYPRRYGLPHRWLRQRRAQREAKCFTERLGHSSCGSGRKLSAPLSGRAFVFRCLTSKMLR